MDRFYNAIRDVRHLLAKAEWYEAEEGIEMVLSAISVLEETREKVLEELDERDEADEVELLDILDELAELLREADTLFQELEERLLELED